MINTIKAEARKIYSIRSTYIVLAFCLALEALFAFYITGWHTPPESLLDAGYMVSQATSAINSLWLFVALVGVLLVTHEYRYNTIVYTLTAGKSRVRVLLAKFLVVSAFAIVCSLVFGWLSPLLSQVAVNVRGLHLGAQTVPIWSLTWRMAVAGWGFAALSFFLAVIIRVQVGAIAAMFLIPSTVENLVGMLLKQNQVYLPFSSLNTLVTIADPSSPHISYARAAAVACAYIVSIGALAFFLFVKRDAN